MPRRRAASVVLIAAVSLLLSSCTSPFSASDGLGDLPDNESPETAGPWHFKLLAWQIDRLEKEIDKYGSVVPKHPDVWGQARMMMHRQEFEREMKKDLTTFAFSVQGSIATSDQAFLAQAFGLQAAAASAAAGTSAPNVTNMVSGNEIISRDKLLTGSTALTYTGGKLTIEPTLLEDQKKRFLDHLHELRRINEGDDNADAPGYALNLVSIPISVLAGDCTQTGCGAECTITANPHLTDDLLPTTFRDLVINDVIDLLALQVTKVTELLQDQGKADLAAKIWQRANRYEQIRAAGGTDADLRALPQVPDPTNLSKEIEALLAQCQPTGISKRPGKQRPISPSEVVPLLGFDRILGIALALRTQSINDHQACKNKLYYLDVQSALRQELVTAYEFLAAEQRSALTEHRPALWDLCTPEFYEAVRSRATPQSRRLSSVLDQFVRMLAVPSTTSVTVNLTRELMTSLVAAKVPAGVLKELGALQGMTFEDPSLFVRAIEPIFERLRTATGKDKVEPSKLDDYKKTIISRFANDGYGNPVPYRAITDALAWVTLLDSTLLNVQFLDDMKTTQTARGGFKAPDAWVPLYLPEPPREVCQVFNDYVRARWPLHIFALDPETDDQNIADSFRLRREMQLALSLAFTSGQIGANSFTRYTRRIESDIDTIALNRTQIGFSHGDNTFGWRFYPRFQTPPIDSNLEAIFRDLLIGGQSEGSRLRRRRIENGIRNCVALVIMPSFVPYVDMDITANWFKLDHPKCKELTLKQVMRLSQEVTTIKKRSTQACDGGQFRPGDTALLMTRLDQLSERLPFQHQLVAVPYENTHGGFELLSAGVTDLGPELVGWYGAPGINPNGDTTLFLVGNNFSVHQTKVLVGGMALEGGCTVACASSTTPAPVECKSSSAGQGGQSGQSGQATGSASTTTTNSTPSTGCCASVAGPDGEVVQASLRPKSCKTPTSATITTVAPAPAPTVTPITITASPTVTSSPTLTASPTSTATASPTITTTVTPTGTAVTTAGAAAPPAATTTPKIYQVELLSRQVVRVVIPKGIYYKDGMVDIHIATPYGVSPALQVPVIGAAPAPAPPAPAGYSVADTSPKLTVNYGFMECPTGGYKVFLAAPPQGSMRINWNDPTGVAPKLIDAAVTFQLAPAAAAGTAATPAPTPAKPAAGSTPSTGMPAPPAAGVNVVACVRLVGKNGYYEIADNESSKCLTTFCAALLDGLSQVHQFAPPDKLLPASLDSTQIEITPVVSTASHPMYSPPMAPAAMPPSGNSGATPSRDIPAIWPPVPNDGLPVLPAPHPLHKDSDGTRTGLQAALTSAAPPIPQKKPTPPPPERKPPPPAG
jgi:hypothetical protein